MCTPYPEILDPPLKYYIIKQGPNTQKTNCVITWLYTNSFCAIYNQLKLQNLTLESNLKIHTRYAVLKTISHTIHIGEPEGQTEHHLEFLSLKGDCTGSSESTLVKMPHCWNSTIFKT